jgi:hypothetical protein
MVSLFLSVNVHAIELTGDWVGKGSLHYDVGSGEKLKQCDEVQLSFRQTATSVTTLTCHYRCGLTELYCGYPEVEIAGTDVLYEGQKVGVVTESSLDIDYKVDEFHGEWHVTRIGEFLHVEDRYAHSDTGTYIETQADLGRRSLPLQTRPSFVKSNPWLYQLLTLTNAGELPAR